MRSLSSLLSFKGESSSVRLEYRRGRAGGGVCGRVEVAFSDVCCVRLRRAATDVAHLLGRGELGRDLDSLSRSDFFLFLFLSFLVYHRSI